MKTSPYLQLHCSSALAGYMEDYVTQKRALGNVCRAEAQVLNQFDDYCIQQGLSEAVLSQDLFDAWCEKRPHENGSTQRTRVEQLRMFAKFLVSNGIPAPTVFFPLPRASRTFVPYIFTHDEIIRLLAVANETEPAIHRGAPSLIHLALPVLLMMLYCCGLRIGESLKLKTEDVDLGSGVLRLLETKGGRERLVPMSASLTRVCSEYRETPIVREYGSEYFFPAPDKSHYAVCTIYDRFRQCLFMAGIPHGGRGKGPRLHDLRHTFAVHMLNMWAVQGRDLYVALPILSVYLGHTSLKSTEQYLRLVPEAYAQITLAFEAGFGDVFPEVADEHA